MRTELILQADLLDILFDNRNKEYGAYALRRDYAANLFKSLATIFFSLCVISIYLNFIKGETTIDKPIQVYDHTLGKIKEEVKPPILKPASGEKTKNTNPHTKNILIVDSTQNTQKIKDYADDSNSDNGTITDSVVTNSSGVIMRMPADAAPEIIIPLPPIDRNVPVDIADEPPLFPGGKDALIKFLQKNLYNPKHIAEDAFVAVKVKFIVGYDGYVKSFEIIQDGGKEFNEEVIRVLKKMPAWIPGKTKGENVSVYYTLPVKFISQE